MRSIKKIPGITNRPRQKNNTVDVLLYISMGTVILLFIPFIIALFKTGLQQNEGNSFIPAIISFNTLVMLFSTRILGYVKKYKRTDQYNQYTTALAGLLLTGFLFLALQLFSIKKILQMVWNNPAFSFLAIIITHTLLMIIAIGILIRLLVQSMSIKCGSELYIYFLDIKKRNLFRCFCSYWNFLSLLWVGVYGILLVINW